MLDSRTRGRVDFRAVQNAEEFLFPLLLFACPLLLGIGAVAAAIALAPKRGPGDQGANQGARKVGAILLGCFGMLCLVLALGAGACFGMMLLQR